MLLGPVEIDLAGSHRVERTLHPDRADIDVIHAVVAMLFIAAMLAHIYIGSIGMEGAFDAMGTGEVDLNWAKEHHSLWVEEEQAKADAPPDRTPRAVPAE